MATRINPCSSSSFKHDIHIPTRRFTIASSRTYRTSKWVSQISSGIHAKRHLELKSSNGYPLNAVPLQDGEFLIPQTAILLSSFMFSFGEMGFWCFPNFSFSFFCIWFFFLFEKMCPHITMFNHYICWIGFEIVLSESLLIGMMELWIWKKGEEHRLQPQDKKTGTKRKTGGYLQYCSDCLVEQNWNFLGILILVDFKILSFNLK